MLEFELRTDLAPIQNTVLDANFDECREALTEMMAPYRSLVVTEDAIGNAKADRARINSISKRIDDTRKTVKNLYTAPLAAFEAKCKELTGICAEASVNIDAQVKAFEQKVKDEKQSRLKEAFTAAAGEVRDFITWEQVFNPRWLNSGFDEAKAISEITTAIGKCADDIKTIRNLNSEFETAILDTYRQHHDLGVAINKDGELRRLKEAEEAQRRLRLEQEAAKAAEKTPAETPAPPVSAPAAIPSAPVRESPPELMVIDFRVTATKEQLSALSDFMRGNGIRYGKVPQK